MQGEAAQTAGVPVCTQAARAWGRRRGHLQQVELHALAEVCGGEHVAEDDLKAVALRVHLVAVVQRNVVTNDAVVDLLRVPAGRAPPRPTVARSLAASQAPLPLPCMPI